jgi:hypothetical protein
MLSHEYDTMRSVEDDYWWYRILRNMTCREVTELAKANPGLQILDAGCGTGGTLGADVTALMLGQMWALRS